MPGSATLIVLITNHHPTIPLTIQPSESALIMQFDFPEVKLDNLRATEEILKKVAEKLLSLAGTTNDKEAGEVMVSFIANYDTRYCQY